MSLFNDSSPNDFDFMIGEWTVTHRRLNARLAGCTEWTEFKGTSSTAQRNELVIFITPSIVNRRTALPKEGFTSKAASTK